MPLESVICRKNLDEERGNAWICECPFCRAERGKESMSDDSSIKKNDLQGQLEDKKKE